MSAAGGTIMRVRDHVAVTGAASGLGRIIAEVLLDRGRAVAIIDRDDVQAHSTAAELSGNHHIEVPVIVADLTDMAEVAAAADQLIDRVRVSALVNNAGGWLPGVQFPDADLDQWLSAMTLNLLAPMLLTQRLWPLLSEAPAGAVVNIGSSGGLGDAPYGSPEYGAAKAAIRRFTASLGSRPEVRVMGIVPGWIGLDRAHREWATLTLEEQREVGPPIPPGDVANTVAELLDHGRPGELIEILRTGEHSSTAVR